MHLSIPSQYLVGGEGDTTVAKIAKQVYGSSAASRHLRVQDREKLRTGNPKEMRGVLHYLYWKRLEACRRFATHRPQCKQLSRQDRDAIGRPVNGRRITQDEHLELISALMRLAKLLEHPLRLVG